jgi:hypothetical protein
MLKRVATGVEETTTKVRSYTLVEILRNKQDAQARVNREQGRLDKWIARELECAKAVK